MYELMRATQRLSVVQDWFELDTTRVVERGQLWRLLTHAFCHDRHAIWHILINMLLLFWFGRTLEMMYGSREFLLFYCTAAVFAGAAYVGMSLYTNSPHSAIGASGAVMAVMMLYTMHFPGETICIWFIQIQMRWLMLLYLIWDLHPILLSLAGDRMFTGIAHAAHLGGLAFGFLYYRFSWRLERLVAWIPALKIRQRPRLQVWKEPLPESRPAEPETDASRLDEVLQKIHVSGQDSLTEEERAILRAASERLKIRARESKDGFY
jgi:membrane associated rhomboid family serine protease